jgi:hypothetical protein
VGEGTVNDRERTNPTAPLSLDEYVAALPVSRFDGIGEDGRASVIRIAESRARELARRLGVDARSGRLPAYVWAIAFAAGDQRRSSTHQD